MKVGILVNSAAGRGRAETYARQLAPALDADGHDVEVCHVNPAPVAWDLDAFVHANDAMVVVGGDGTLQSTTSAARRAGTPLYHAPFGTENLFARELSMVEDIDVVRETLRTNRVDRLDLGRCDDKPFLLMLSIGFDANVVHRLARRRQGTITHLSYVRPIVAELVHGVAPRLTVEIDGKPLVCDEPGLLVIANSRQYALRIDPAPGASMTDGKLDVVFFPAGTPFGLLLWAARARFRVQHRSPRLITGRAREIKVSSSNHMLVYQVDGEAAGDLGNARSRFATREPEGELDIGVIPAALPVLRT